MVTDRLTLPGSFSLLFWNTMCQSTSCLWLTPLIKCLVVCSEQKIISITHGLAQLYLRGESDCLSFNFTFAFYVSLTLSNETRMMPGAQQACNEHLWMNEWNNWSMLPFPLPNFPMTLCWLLGSQAIHKCFHLLTALFGSEFLTTIHLYLKMILGFTWPCQVIVPNFMVCYV